MNNDISRAIVGISGSLTAVAITMTTIEQTIRVAGSAVGLAIGVLTLISMLKKRTEK